MEPSAHMRAAGEGGRDARLDEGLPARRVGVAVHPEAHVEQHGGGQQRGDALGDLAARPR